MYMYIYYYMYMYIVSSKGQETRDFFLTGECSINRKLRKLKIFDNAVKFFLFFF